VPQCARQHAVHACNSFRAAAVDSADVTAVHCLARIDHAALTELKRQQAEWHAALLDTALKCIGTHPTTLDASCVMHTRNCCAFVDSCTALGALKSGSQAAALGNLHSSGVLLHRAATQLAAKQSGAYGSSSTITRTTHRCVMQSGARTRAHNTAFALLLDSSQQTQNGIATAVHNTTPLG
jgi:hypothetical protein